MTTNFPVAEKLEFIENAIVVVRDAARDPDGSAEARYQFEMLKALAADYRARLNHAPAETLIVMNARVTAVIRSKTGLGYDAGRLAALGYEVIGRWSVIKQAIEKFGGDK